MAKQSGLHQLRGKVGEFSYYKQTGVSSGLIRSINQGMSARVKTSDEYANVRLNNAEFGQSGRIASVLAQYINPKYRPMVLPFSQAKMAKIILEYIKTDSTAPWGQRNIVADNSGEMQVAALNSVVKNHFDEFGVSLQVNEENLSLSIALSSQTVSKLSSIGANGFEYRFFAIGTWIGTYLTNTDRYAPTLPQSNLYNDRFDDPAGDENDQITYTIPAAPPQRFPAFQATRTGLFMILPYRTINGQNYILQENCTFKAFILQDGPVN